MCDESLLSSYFSFLLFLDFSVPFYRQTLVRNQLDRAVEMIASNHRQAVLLFNSFECLWFSKLKITFISCTLQSLESTKMKLNFPLLSFYLPITWTFEIAGFHFHFLNH